MKHLIHLLMVFLWIIKLQSQSSWTQVSLPATTPATGSLFEIKVLDPQLAFAVGNKVPSSGPNQGLIFKYNGTTWTEVSNPISGNGITIRSIGAVSSNEYYIVSGKRDVHYWNGSSWSNVSANLPDYNTNANFDNRTLSKVIAFSSNDVYVVGLFLNTSSGSGDMELYVAHFNGTTWSKPSVPQSPTTGSDPAGTTIEVDASSPSDIWIAKRGYISSPGMAQLGIWHFNGANWSLHGETIPSAGNVFLQDVDVVAPNDVWFTGYYGSPSEGTVALYVHYNGTSYNYLTQTISGSDYQRYCIGALDGNSIWSGRNGVGSDFTYYDGTSWSSQTTIISTNSGGVRDIKRANDCLWAVGYSGSPLFGANPMLLETCLTSLPTELTTFDAVPIGQSVALSWTTLSETNSAYFDVQKSVDGTSWRSFEQVVAHGNSHEPQKYTAFDTNPHTADNYYRLKMVDADGSFAYSSISRVHLILKDKFNIFPNPSQGQITVSLQEVEDQKIQVFNTMGKLVYQVKGVESTVLDLSWLNPGVYIVKYGAISEIMVLEK